jgi:PAS domain-containing protein
MNPAAEEFTRVSQEEAVGMSVTALMGFPDNGAIQPADNPAQQAMKEMRLVTIDGATVFSRQGERRTIRGSVAPVVDDGGAVLGAVFVFHERAPRDQSLAPSNGQDEAIWRMEERLGRPQGIINLCSWCKRVPDQSGEWYDLATFIAERSAIQFNGGLCPDCMDQCFPCDGRHT